MQIEKLTPQDLQELKELQPEGWSDITPYFEFYTNSPFCHPIKVLSGNRIAGIGTSILHKTSAWVAHIIVHPDFRNRGIGGIVTKSVRDAIDHVKYPTVSLIATPLGEPVYRKLGFQPETDYLFYKNESYTPVPKQNPLIADADPSCYNEILNFDKKASGEERTGILEPHLQSVKIYRSNNKINGFYAPDLGDGLIVAENETAGLELLKLKLQMLPFSVVPSDNEAAVNFLQEQGFQQFLKGTRMSIGERIDFKPKMLFNRIGGNLG